MNTLLLALSFPGGAIGLLFKIAIVCVIAWGIWQLILWTGFQVPRPLVIIAIVVICIVVLYWLFELLQLAL